MAYSGTGTQADPYLVSTFADFRTCIQQAEAYVKLTADIDVFAEGYTTAMNSLTISAAKVYSDDGCTISNLNIYDGGIFSADKSTSSTGCVIENINFDDVIFKNTQVGCVLSQNGTYKLTFRRCRIRVSCTYNNHELYVFSNILAEDCGIYIEFIGTYHGSLNKLEHNPAANGTILRRTTVEIVNLQANYLIAFSRTLINNFVCEYCTLKLDLFPSDIAGASNVRGAELFSRGSHDNIVVCTVNGNELDTDTFTCFTNGLTAADTTNSVLSRSGGGTLKFQPRYEGAVQLLTYEQITSEEYLRSTGFIP